MSDEFETTLHSGAFVAHRWRTDTDVTVESKQGYGR